MTGTDQIRRYFQFRGLLDLVGDLGVAVVVPLLYGTVGPYAVVQENLAEVVFFEDQRQYLGKVVS